MKTMLAAFAAASLPLVATGCSSIIEGRSQTLSFASNPPGASCTLTRNGAVIGKLTTPAGLVVEKTKHDIHVICSKDGYEDSTAFLKSEVAGATFGNIILGGGIGWAIDSASGADNKYQEVTTVTLNPKIPQIVPAVQSAPIPDPSQQKGVEARLLQLKQLLDQNLITQTEYEERRQTIIQSL